MPIPVDRNPLNNNELNPLMNNAINPLMNSEINPLMNSIRNPLMNSEINPLMNNAINPLMNDAINYLVNDSINPHVNEAINPLINQAYGGPFFFTMHGTPAGFGVAADGGVVVLFSELLAHAGIAVPVGDMLMIFDVGNRWIGYLVPNGAGGYARFDISGQWVG